jgi:hypothetical protein
MLQYSCLKIGSAPLELTCRIKTAGPRDETKRLATNSVSKETGPVILLTRKNFVTGF